MLLRPFPLRQLYLVILAKMTTTIVEPNPASLVFAFPATMTFEDSVKEVYSKMASSALPTKMTMQAMIVIVMVYESVSATARTVTAVSETDPFSNTRT